MKIAPRAGSAVEARAKPSTAQLRWQREELAMFAHLGLNTFTDAEWGSGSEDPKLFNPAGLDADQWARTARDNGFGTVIVTTKHHDGFCLWPTASTDYSVRSSPWRDGQGDVVGEAARACANAGIRFGVYCSPWDRNSPTYGSGAAYNELFLTQLRELLTGYGDLAEVWFDGAVGETDQGKQAYDWEAIIATVRELQPNAVIFSDAGPDLRWVGNEEGVASHTTWSTIDPAQVPQPGSAAPWTLDALRHGDPEGVWRPAETDVSIRPGWFWHESESPRTPENLLDLYLSSVGRNSKLLLNVPPDRNGLLDARDVESLAGFTRLREEFLGTDLLAEATVEVDGNTLVLTPPTSITPVEGADLYLRLAEDIADGQRVASFRIQYDDGTGWQPLASGSTIGYQRIIPIRSVTTPRLKVVTEHSYGPARLTEVALHVRPNSALLRRPDRHD